ncbi:MAG: SDR family oxidoreductase, partial [Saprospiraceae bacterium]|nr:SDR family oxidoreductase [Saprospiraceae bacterium]
AYYLVHSMSSSDDYAALEEKCAINFRNALNQTEVRHVIYLSGIVNETELSKHLNSRLNVEIELNKGAYNLTTLRAGIIIGSGSASFEIIRDLVEKLPVMIAPKWLKTKCQPIGVSDVITFLTKTLFNSQTYNNNYDIGSPDILSYKEMLLGFARIRNLKRTIIVVPVMTPRLSSYWLYFVTSTSYKLAVSLVSSMKVEVICRDSDINTILNINPISYKEALEKAFSKIESNEIISSWKDSYASSGINFNVSDFIQVPSYGCFIDKRKSKITNHELCKNKIWSIGGETGWYYADWLWKIRGYLDKIVGGVGLRRGRTNLNSINPGDAVDFWRVLYADKDEGRLLLFAEMKLPGEAWLEFKIVEDELIQTATFRPLGLWGRLYWYSVLPFHGIIFNGMLKKLTK